MPSPGPDTPLSGELLASLEPHLTRRETPEGQVFYSVAKAGVEALAAEQGWPLVRAMSHCLEAGIWPERLRPNRGTYTPEEQARLLGCRAAVIGCGGLGGGVILSLARAGLGALTLCDGDVFEESNLNRQDMCTVADLGRAKARVATDKALAVSPYCAVRTVQAWADAANLPGILEGADVVLDCLDGLPMRYLLEKTCRQLGLTYVHGAVGGLEGMVMTVRPGEPGLAGLYGPEPAAERGQGAEASVGVPTPTPRVVGGLQASEAILALLGRPRLAGGRCLHVDLLAPSLEVLRLAGVEEGE